MSEKTFQLITLGQAMETLGLDRESFWEQAQAANAKLLLQLPSGAVLQAQNETLMVKPKTRLGRSTQERFRTDLPLTGKDYFVPNSALLIEIGKLPEVACDYVTHVATRLRGQSVVSIVSIGKAAHDIHSIDPLVELLCKAVPLGLLLPENTSVTLDLQRTYLLEEDIERIRNSNTTHYPPGIEDYGAFKPSEYTTRMICEMNTAYHLFRIKNPIDPKDPSSRVLVKDWFDATWNSGETKKAVDDVLTKATEVILQSNPKITIGTLTMRDTVIDQHAEGTPYTLMLMEQLAQDRGVWTRSGPHPDGSISFGKKESMESDLKAAEVGPDRYIRLISRVLGPSR